MSPAAISFLNKTGMDFGTWTKEGVPYVLERKAEFMQQRFDTKYPKAQEEKERDSNERDEKKSETDGKDRNVSGENSKIVATQTAPPPQSRKVGLSRPHDIEFVARAMATLREWIDNSTTAATSSPAPNTSSNGPHSSRASTAELVLPPCNSFLRRALYESISSTYPSLALEPGDKDDPTRRNCIVVLRLTPEERQARAEERRKAEEKQLLMNIGFYSIFKALSEACRGEFSHAEEGGGDGGAEDRNSITAKGTAFRDDEKMSKKGIPIIVHNGLMDLLFLLTHFVTPTLPPTWMEAKALVNKHFPLVYDTKLMAEECSNNTHKFGSTALGELFEFFGNNEGKNWPSSTYNLAPKFKELYAPTTPESSSSKIGTTNGVKGSDKAISFAHEAGYDAYMTGCVFNSLCKMHSFQDLVSLRNKLHLMQSIYTITLDSPNSDPLRKGMHPCTTYRMSSGIEDETDRNTTYTRDVVLALSSCSPDSDYNREDGYEIIWVDDVTFLVATRSSSHILFKESDKINEENKEVCTRHYRMAKRIYTALKTNFPTHSIMTWEEWLSHNNKCKQNGGCEEETSSSKRKRKEETHILSPFTTFVSGIIKYIFVGNSVRDADGDGKKRRRIINNGD